MNAHATAGLQRSVERRDVGESNDQLVPPGSRDPPGHAATRGTEPACCRSRRARRQCPGCQGRLVPPRARYPACSRRRRDSAPDSEARDPTRRRIALPESEARVEHVAIERAGWRDDGDAVPCRERAGLEEAWRSSHAVGPGSSRATRLISRRLSYPLAPGLPEASGRAEDPPRHRGEAGPPGPAGNVRSATTQ